jgi:hypothetical protein
MKLSDLPSLPFFLPLIIAILMTAAHLILSFSKTWVSAPLRRRGALALILVLAAIALAVAIDRAARWNPAPTNSHEAGIADMPASTCIVFDFPDAEAYATDPALKLPPPQEQLEKLPQDPAGCIEQLQRWIGAAMPHQLTINGRADRRPLKPATQKRVISNEMLAFRRAQSVAQWIVGAAKSSDPKRDDLSPRTLVGVSGLRYGKETGDPQLFEQDRSVEVRSYWATAPAHANTTSSASTPVIAAPAQTNSSDAGKAEPTSPVLSLVGVKINDEAMEPAVSLTVLSLFVALSAYLATVGFFLRQRVFDLDNEVEEIKIKLADPALKAPASQEKAKPGEEHIEATRASYTELETRHNKGITKTKRALRLLPIADLPMIMAALLLGLHLFFFLSTGWLRASIVFATFSAFVLVMQHGAQWFVTIRHVYKETMKEVTQRRASPSHAPPANQ